MEHYTKIDMATWPRREHYRYYSQTLKVEFNMTAPVNVKNLLGFCRANGYRFYPAAIYRAVTADMQTFGGNHGIKAKPGQPANFYCVSCTPWVSFTGCGSRVTGSSEPAFFPIIVMGRYEESGGAVRMPVALSIAHAVADGYHAALFFRYLQEEMDALAASGAGF